MNNFWRTSWEHHPYQGSYISYNEFTCQSCNEAAFATSWRTIEKVSSSVWNSTRRVPLWAVDEVVDIVKQTFRQTGTENDGRERSTSAWISKLSPLGAGCREHDRLAFLLWQRSLPCAVQYVGVKLVLTTKRSQSDRLPRYSSIQV